MSALIDTRPSDVAPNALIVNYPELPTALRDRLDVVMPALTAVAVAALVMGIATGSAAAIVAGGFGAVVLTRALMTLAQMNATKPTDR